MVNGPIRNQIGMNVGIFELVPGNRANATMNRWESVMKLYDNSSRMKRIMKGAVYPSAEIQYCV